MLTFIIVPLVAVIAGFLSIAVFERGNVTVAAFSALAGSLGAFIAMILAGGIATGISDEETESKWNVYDVRSYTVDGTTVYSYSSGGSLYEFHLSTRGNMLGETDDNPYLRKVCGVTPSFISPFDMGECTSTLFVND